MKKDILIVLGNGLSIDFVHECGLNEQIDLSNLFARGDYVFWPGNDEPGFLSQRRCPALWELGARPKMENGRAQRLIEDIITCANVSAFSNRSTTYGGETNVYIKAYYELVTYLKYLFIFYNHLVSDDIIMKVIGLDWGWSKLFKNLNENKQISSVSIITYNYDILVERILKAMAIEYQIVGFDSTPSKFSIIKPHGSISFRSKKEYDKTSFSIKYNRDSLGGAIDELICDEEVNFDKISNINTMIPPAGESERYPLIWSKTLRDEAIKSVKQLKEEDEVIFAGLSYCNVDRREIDEIITNLNKDVYIKVVNPNSDSTFGAVLSSVFSQYTHYTDSKVLGGLFHD